MFLFALAAFAVNRWLIEPSVPPPSVFHSYLNDFICIAFWLPPALWLERHLGLRRNDRPPSIAEVARYVVVWSILFEWVAPCLTSQATSDPVDIVAYTAGGLAAWIVWNAGSISLISDEHAASRL